MGAWPRQNAAVLAVGVGLAGVLYQVSDIAGRMDSLDKHMVALEAKVDNLAAVVAANRDAIADIQARLPTFAITPGP